jgi:hypothetical protein
MKELTPQDKKLIRLAKLVADKEVGVAKELDILDEKIISIKEKVNEALKVAEETQKMEGQVGEVGEKGEKGDKGDIGEKGDSIKGDKGDKGDTTIVEKVIERTEVIKEQPIVTENIIEKAVTDEPIIIAEKLNTLENVLEPKVIKGYLDLERITKENSNRLYTGVTETRVNELIAKIPISTPDLSAYLKLDQTTPQTTLGTLHFPDFSADFSLGTELAPPLTGVSGINWVFNPAVITSPLAGSIVKYANGGTPASVSSITLTLNKLYRFTIVVSSFTVGTLQVNYGGYTYTVPSLTTGTFTFDIVGNGSGYQIVITSGTNARWTISSISLKEVLNGNVLATRIQNPDGWSVLTMGKNTTHLNLSDPIVGYDNKNYNFILGGDMDANSFNIDNIKNLSSKTGFWGINYDGSAQFADGNISFNVGGDSYFYSSNGVSTTTLADGTSAINTNASTGDYSYYANLSDTSNGASVYTQLGATGYTMTANLCDTTNNVVGWFNVQTSVLSQTVTIANQFATLEAFSLYGNYSYDAQFSNYDGAYAGYFMSYNSSTNETLNAYIASSGYAAATFQGSSGAFNFNASICNVLAGIGFTITDGSNSVSLSDTGNAIYAVGRTNLNGGLILGYKEVSTTYPIVNNDYTINCTTGTFTVTLPDASVVLTGHVYNIKNSGAGTITLATTSSQKIDGASTQSIATKVCLTVQSTGSNWIIISNKN